MSMLTVHFLNCGQDFLEFDISNGLIVASRPEESAAWRHFQVVTPVDEIEPGIRLEVRSRKLDQAPVMTIKHPVVKVEHHSAM